ncbi:MAG: RecQ family ATP-dependent DNA helicase [Acidimicrobiales bacterium]
MRLDAEPEAAAADLHEAASDVLAHLAGSGAVLRDDQWEAIEALVVHHRRALVVQRTGWGKSAVYFVATALLRRRGAGPTVLVSPLLALMRNQIAAADRAGIRAVTVNSSNTEEWREIYARVRRGDVDVLLVSPERLNNPGFRDAVLPSLAADCGLLVVDEAHCISDWGHDFRPDYRRLRTLLPELPSGTPVLATTATANARVMEDVAEVLGLGGGTDPVLVQRGSLDRESLCLSVVPLPDHAHRVAWLAEHLDDWEGSGIVYTLTVAAAEDTAAILRSAGHQVLAYSGQADEAARLEAEQALSENRVKALVATSALGMGFDKPDLGFLVHLGAPQSPVAYYQQVGRAGRATERAEVVLLPGAEDEAIWRYFASVGLPTAARVRRVLDALKDAGDAMSTPALEALVDLSRTRLETLLKILDVDGAVRRVQGGWEATGEPWAYDADRYARVAAARATEQQAMRDYVATGGCRMEFLRAQLDDPGAAPCGRCDNCLGRSAGAAVSETALGAARERLSRPGVSIGAKKRWPANMPALGVPVGGRIAPEEAAEEGRAVARLSGLGLGTRIRELLDPGSPDHEVPGDVLDAAVTVLSTWKREWPERPSAVVAVGSNGRSRLIVSLAQAIAEAGRLPYLGVVEHRGPSVAGRTNSAHRLAAVWGTYRLPQAVLEGLGPVAGKAVLVVDDQVDTGWTLAVVVRELRRAGAGRVLPLAVASVR